MKYFQRFHARVLDDLTRDDIVPRDELKSTSTSAPNAEEGIQNEHDIQYQPQPRRFFGSGLAVLGRGMGADIVLALLLRTHSLALQRLTVQKQKRLKRDFQGNTNAANLLSEPVGCVLVLNVPDNIRKSVTEMTWLLQDSVLQVHQQERHSGGDEGSLPSFSSPSFGASGSTVSGRSAFASTSNSSTSVPLVLTGETPERERILAYKGGNVVFCASQIALMDVLYERLLPAWCAGVIIWRADSVREHSPVAFVLRLLRAGKQRLRQAAMWKNSRLADESVRRQTAAGISRVARMGGPSRVAAFAATQREDPANPLPQPLFVHALSEDPVSVVRGGFNAVSRLLQVLGIPPHRLSLWPRFRDVVKADFGDCDEAECLPKLDADEQYQGDKVGDNINTVISSPLDVVVLHIPMTAHMEALQRSIVRVAAAVFAELESSRALTDCTDLFQLSYGASDDAVPESMLAPDFASRVLSELRPQWDKLGSTARHMAYDVRLLRRLLFSVVRLDSVSFWREVRNVADMSGKFGVWNLSEHAPIVFSMAQERVFYSALPLEQVRESVPTSGHEAKSAPKAEDIQTGSFLDFDDILVEEIGGDSSQTEFEYNEPNTVARERSEQLKKEEDDTTFVGRSNDRTVEAAKIVDTFLGENVVLDFEPQPKWKVLKDVLDEIQTLNGGTRGPVLVLFRDICTLEELTQIIADPKSSGDFNVRSRLFLHKKWIRAKSEIEAGSAKRSLRENDNFKGFDASTQPRYNWKKAPPKADDASKTQAAEDARRMAAPPTSDSEPSDVEVGEREEDETDLRSSEPELIEEQPNVGPRADPYDVLNFDELFGLLDESDQNIVFHAYGTGVADPSMTALWSFIVDLCPQFVCVYDVDLAVFRVLERYAAAVSQFRLETGVRVYWLAYESGADTQMYDHANNKEYQAFCDLVKEKGRIVHPTLAAERFGSDGMSDASLITQAVLDLPPIPPSAMPQASSLHALSFTGQRIQLNDTRRRNDTESLIVKPPARIIVDSREFRSSLPSILFSDGFKLIPATIDVGDYILTPLCAVERKALEDLIQSLASGRLFKQATQMCVYFPDFPVLSIEFDNAKQPFRIASEFTQFDDISSRSLVSRIALLLLHFPKLRVFWAKSPAHAARIFARVKENAARLAVAANQTLLRESLTTDESSLAQELTSRVEQESVPQSDPVDFWTDSDSRSTNSNVGAITHSVERQLTPTTASSSISSEVTINVGNHEPSLGRLKIADGDEEMESQPVKMLLQLPGIDRHNFRNVTRNVKNLFELVTLSEHQLAELIGRANSAQLFAFLHTKRKKQ